VIFMNSRTGTKMKEKKFVVNLRHLHYRWVIFCLCPNVKTRRTQTKHQACKYVLSIMSCQMTPINMPKKKLSTKAVWIRWIEVLELYSCKEISKMFNLKQFEKNKEIFTQMLSTSSLALGHLSFASHAASSLNSVTNLKDSIIKRQVDLQVKQNFYKSKNTILKTRLFYFLALNL
jgi:hypothetical protein